MKRILLLVTALLIFTSCGKDNQSQPLQSSTSPQLASIAISGSYVDGYNSSHSINNENWVITFNDDSSTYEILSFDNEEQRLIALNGDDSFNPGEYSVFEWVIVDGNIYYCQSVYNAETLEDAESAEKSDSLDPTEGGCGDYDFPWTELN